MHTGEGSVWCVCVVKITPNFSFAWTLAPCEGGGDTRVWVSEWEQRNAAVVVRVLGGRRRRRREGG